MGNYGRTDPGERPNMFETFNDGQRGPEFGEKQLMALREEDKAEIARLREALDTGIEVKSVEEVLEYYRAQFPAAGDEITGSQVQ